MKEESITERFIKEYQQLKTSGALPSNEELAKLLGYKQPSSITEILKQRQEIPATRYEKFRNHFFTDSVIRKQNHIRTRQHLKDFGDEKNGIMVYESAPTHASFKQVYHDDPEHQVPDYVLRIPQFRDCNYGTRASGDSMYPEVRNGDLIICKELSIDARIIFGDMYVVHTKDGIETIKYIHQFVDDEDKSQVLLVPHNKAAGMGTPIPRNEIVRLFKVRAIFKAY